MKIYFKKIKIVNIFIFIQIKLWNFEYFEHIVYENVKNDQWLADGACDGWLAVT